MVQVNALFHSDEFFVCLVIQKQKKTAPRVPKLCYFNGRVPKPGDTRNLVGLLGLSYPAVLICFSQ